MCNLVVFSNCQINRLFATLIFLLSMVGTVFAGIDPYSVSVNVTVGQPSTFFITQDHDYDPSHTIHKVTNFVFFEIDEASSKIASDACAYEASLLIKLWNQDNIDNTSPDITYIETLTLDYDPDTKKLSDYKAFKKYSGAHKIEVVINSITGCTLSGVTAPDLRVRAEIFVDREYPLSMVPTSIEAGGEEMDPKHEITWNSIYGAEEYDLEWTFYDFESNVGRKIFNGQANTLNFPGLFKNNATRVSLKENQFTIQALYPKGYVLFRVRGVQVGVDGQRIHGPWEMDNDQYYMVEWHEGGGINFQASTNFSENGINLPTVKYIDDSGRSRQNVALSNATEKSIYLTTHYDQHGRKALNTLPSPREENYLSFDANQTLTPSGDKYSKINFTEGDYNTVPLAMGSGGGVGNYYSSSNSSIDPTSLDLINHLPDAEGYPFTVIEYTPDETGRMARSSNYGATFQFEGGHDTRYFYGKPAQEELDRLFGNDAGDASHYHKNATVDANGQVSVSYLDLKERLVAQALAGPKPDNVEILDTGYENETTITVDLLSSNEPIGYALVSSYKHISTATGLNTFNYSLNELVYQDDCVPSNFCYDCLYDLEIKITDSRDNAFNNNEPFIYTADNFSAASALDLQCTDSETGAPIVASFDLMMPIGEYTITKTLRISEESLDYYTEHFMDNQTCVNFQDFFDSYLMDIDDSGCDMTCESCLEDLGTQAGFTAALIAEVANAGGTMDQASADAVYDLRASECTALCGDLPTECEVWLGMLLTDVSPLGQYALFELNDQDEIITTDEASIFYNNVFQNIAGDYLDENGAVDMIYNTEGMLVTAKQLDARDFIKNFKPSWALTLAQEFHPEWCVYDTWCNGMNYDDSADFDAELLEFDCFADAVAAGYADINGILNDPLFTTLDPTGECQALMDDLLANISWGNIESPSVMDYVVDIFYGDCQTHIDTTCSPLDNEAWAAFLSIYLGFKNQIVNQKLEDQVNCPDVECIGNGEAICNDQTNIYKDKIRRLIYEDYLANSPLTSADIDAAVLDINGQLEVQCDDVCTLNVELWLNELSECDLDALGTQLVDMKARLIDVCILGCDFTHDGGSSTTANGVGTVIDDFTSFEEVLIHYLGSQLNPCDLGCNSLSISSMRPYEKPIHPGPTPTNSLQNNCICENLTELKTCYDNDVSGNYASFAEYLVQYSEYVLVQEQLDDLLGYCDPTYTEPLMPKRYNIPAYLECNTCQDCGQIAALKTTFDNTNACSETGEDYWEVLARYLNNELGFNQSGYDYEAFVNKCATPGGICAPSLMICPTTGTKDMLAFANANPCLDGLLMQVGINASLALEQALAALRLRFRNDYVNHCINGAEEMFEGLFLSQEYHYTLYCYDQSGALRQTVPPKGIHQITESTELAAVKAYRENGTGSPLYPSHEFIMRYEYNSLGSITRLSSPDALVSQSWYDELGRSIIAQDGRQQEQGLCTYMLYDELGRAREVGEVSLSMASYDISTSLSNSHFITLAEFNQWLSSFSIGAKRAVTRTYYDEANYTIAAFGTEGQENLRTRVSTSTREGIDDGDDQTYDFATHYSYDVTGNVKVLIQETTSLHEWDQGFKRMDYAYDYISGKVLYLYYQKGEVDQFTHHYEYDENNRLRRVYTSFVDTDYYDGGAWEEEAVTDYYDHGPKGRVVLGEQQVQGCDYFYALQGWLKGVNSTMLDVDKDMGRDGNTSFTERSTIGRDVLGYTLNYYTSDYQSISNSGIEASIAPGSNVGAAASDLFNGNIRAMTIHNKRFSEAVAYAYSYDQLHRLKSMESFDNLNPTSYEWETTNGLASKYKMNATYDGNGNMGALQRHGLTSPGAATTTLIDDLEFTYTDGTNQLANFTESSPGCDPILYITEPVNIESISQALDEIYASSWVTGEETVIFRAGESLDLLPGFEVTSVYADFTAAVEDCEPLGAGQGTMSYEYDGSGNVVRDENGALVEWDMYGKIKEISQLGDDQLDRINYTYDAMGNRVSKIYTSGSTGSIAITYYFMDVSGRSMAMYELKEGKLSWEEQYLYGASRFGVVNEIATWTEVSEIGEVPYMEELGKCKRGQKYYELSDHLGNILSVINDRKQKVDEGTDGQADYYEATIVAATEYYPYGLAMPQRSYSSTSYRYGFNGVESSPELGEGYNTTFFRQQDTRIGRWWSFDPKPNPGVSPYTMMGGNPIRYSDVLGDTLKFNDPVLQTAAKELARSSKTFKKVYDALDASTSTFEIGLDNLSGDKKGTYNPLSGKISIDQMRRGTAKKYKAALSEEMIHAHQSLTYGFGPLVQKKAELFTKLGLVKHNMDIMPRETFNESAVLFQIEMVKAGEKIAEKMDKTFVKYLGNGASFVEVEAKLIRAIVRSESRATSRAMSFSIHTGSTGGEDFGRFIRRNGTKLTSHIQINAFYQLQLRFQTYYKMNSAAGKNESYKKGAKNEPPLLLNKLK